jgi:hypothetical protein
VLPPKSDDVVVSGAVVAPEELEAPDVPVPLPVVPPPVTVPVEVSTVVVDASAPPVGQPGWPVEHSYCTQAVELSVDPVQGSAVPVGSMMRALLVHFTAPPPGTSTEEQDQPSVAVCADGSDEASEPDLVQATVLAAKTATGMSAARVWARRRLMPRHSAFSIPSTRGPLLAEGCTTRNFGPTDSAMPFRP